MFHGAARDLHFKGVTRGLRVAGFGPDVSERGSTWHSYKACSNLKRNLPDSVSAVGNWNDSQMRHCKSDLLLA